jgi:hypothetical protein
MFAWGFIAAVLIANFCLVARLLRVGLKRELQNYFASAV